MPAFLAGSLRAALTIALIGSATSGFLCSHSSIPVRRRAPLPVHSQGDPDVATVRLKKPMGMILEEIEPGNDAKGVRVGRMDPKGSAAQSGQVLILDQIATVDGNECLAEGFDTIMDLIIDAPGPEVEIGFARDKSTTVVRFPNGVKVGALPGEPMKFIVGRSAYPIKYSCEGGSCATCEMKMQIYDLDGEEDLERYIRVCVGRVPQGSSFVGMLPSDR
mmetsp:Transcript_25610/g.57449  ORF Transcript_25610/g.57449 Transcript_25610/m.57449 type:complete len:219 (+) Transcript_25610:33-689(+)